MVVTVYVEGGGDSAHTRGPCRRAFGKFLERAGFRGNMPRVVACGPRHRAYDDFRTSLGKRLPGNTPVLLVDSEAPVATAPWDHLRRHSGDGWERPEGASDDQIHLMVQCMESWFLADRGALAEFYGHGFREKALPGSSDDVEAIPKADVLDGLRKATRDARGKGEYSKTRHAFEILESLNPSKVLAASRHAARFLDALRNHMFGGKSQKQNRAGTETP